MSNLPSSTKSSPRSDKSAPVSSINGQHPATSPMSSIIEHGTQRTTAEWVTAEVVGMKQAIVDFSQRLDSLERRFDNLEGRFDSFETRFQAHANLVNDRFTAMELNYAALNNQLATIINILSDITSRNTVEQQTKVKAAAPE